MISSKLSITSAIAVTAFGVLVQGASAQTVTVTLPAIADNTLYQDFLGNFSNGLGPSLFAGKTQGGDIRRALVRFDLSAIPTGATISSASMTLRQSRQRDSTQPEVMAIHRVLASWGEGTSNAGSPGGSGAPSTNGDATWIHRFYNETPGLAQLWANAGGDFNETPSGTASVGSALTTYTWTGARMVTDVQGWIDDRSSNFGWILLGDETENQSARRFDSRESGTSANRPGLVVRYVIPAPGAAAALALGGLVLTRRRRA